MAESDPFCQLLETSEDYRYRLEKNTYVVDSLALMYMDTPKTAGTSIKTMLAKFQSDYRQPEDSLSLETLPEMFIHDRALNPLRPITDYSTQLQREMLFSDSWKRICVVRNPYDRIFSAWFSKLLLRQPGYMDALSGYCLPEKVAESTDIYRLFDEFLIYISEHGCSSDPHWDLQTKLLFHNTIKWGRIFRFEGLQDQLTVDAEYFGPKKLVLENLNVSGFSPDWSCVSNRTIDLIQAIYRSDFEEYGYSLSPPPYKHGADIVAVYVNAVSGRNIRLGALIQRRAQDRMQLDSAQGEIQSLQARLAEIKLQLATTQSTLDEITNSRSWKLTLPLRMTLDFIKAIYRRHL
jgi:hypothetical protein